LSVDNDIIKKSGSWFSYGDNRLGQGGEKVKKFLLENPEIMKEIEEKVKKILNLNHEDEEENNNKK